MPSFEEVLARQDELITSPDGGISARLVNGKVTTLEFAPNRYHAYSDASLEGQISKLAKLVYVKRRRSRINAIQESLGGEPVEYRKPQTPLEEAFLEEQREYGIKLQSANMVVQVIGGLNWTVKLRPGTVRRVPESEFAVELATTIGATIREWRSAVRALRVKIYGPSQLTWAFKETRRKD